MEDELIQEETIDTYRANECQYTLDFSSPEMIEFHYKQSGKKRVNKNSDLFSLGVVLSLAIGIKLAFFKQSLHEIKKILLFKEELMINKRITKD